MESEARWSRTLQRKTKHFWFKQCFSPQTDDAVVGFISVTADVDLKQVHDSFEFAEFNDLYKVQQRERDEPAAPADAREDGEELGRVQTPASLQVTVQHVCTTLTQTEWLSHFILLRIITAITFTVL